MAVAFVFREEHLEFDVLVGGEDAAHAVEHHAARAAEFGAGRLDLGDELVGRGFVGRPSETSFDKSPCSRSSVAFCERIAGPAP